MKASSDPTSTDKKANIEDNTNNIDDNNDNKSSNLTQKPVQKLVVHSMHANRSTHKAEINNSWATTISRYLLKRRKQTKKAYAAQLQPISDDAESQSEPKIPQNIQNWLFEVLFEGLIQRLEEGHTVMALTAYSELTIQIPELFAWQQQLLQPVLQPLLQYMENIYGQNYTQNLKIDRLLEHDHALWKTALLQSSLTQYEQQVLQHRYELFINTYTYFKNNLSSTSNTEDGLNHFISIIKQNPLIQEKQDSHQYIDDEDEKVIIFNVNANTLTLWLHRTWQAEHDLAQHIIRIKNQNIMALAIVLNPLLNSEQQDAIDMANRSAFSIITGGPGTGKTFTVAQLVIALQSARPHNNQSEHDGSERSRSSHEENLALAAPTGKAAQRMQESLQNAITQADINIQLPEAKTIHRLLGIGEGGQPRYHAKNPLSEDIIIVDEASMLGVELANHLVSAIKPGARLILLGDANQLAAVDAGAVLADLCRIPALQRVHKRLESSRRFSDDSGIGKLSKLVNQKHHQQNNEKDPTTQHVSAIWQLIKTDNSLSFYQLSSTVKDNKEQEYSTTKIAPDTKNGFNTLSNYDFLRTLLNEYDGYIRHTKDIFSDTKALKTTPNSALFNELINTFNTFRVLTASHNGRCGDHYINQFLSEQHKKKLKLPLSNSDWYHGRPIMILQNNYELGLFNGDIGICLLTEQGRLQVYFENKEQGFSTNMLSNDMVATAYAMTIHKSQGSEFTHVAISFDDTNERLLSQELLYTAITRAKKQVTIFSTPSAFTCALSTPTLRQTGLALQFSQFD